jgi:hypothetical protein
VFDATYRSSFSLTFKFEAYSVYADTDADHIALVDDVWHSKFPARHHNPYFFTQTVLLLKHPLLFLCFYTKPSRDLTSRLGVRSTLGLHFESRAHGPRSLTRILEKRGWESLDGYKARCRACDMLDESRKPPFGPPAFVVTAATRRVNTVCGLLRN